MALSFSLEGRIAIVTGAGRGLGQAIAIALAEAGATVCITGRSQNALLETKGKIEALGGTCSVSAQDVLDLSTIAPVLDGFLKQHGRIDILVNNAGMEKVSPSFDVDEALWDQIISTNLKGAFFWSQAVGKQMAAQGHGGAIVNMCSLTSYVGVPTAVPYGSSKSGLMGMTKALAAEWASHGIRVNALAPGYFRTAMTEVFYENGDWQKSMLEKIPQGRFGQDSDVGGAAIFLCSDASAYVTGHCIPVDGGFLASI